MRSTLFMIPKTFQPKYYRDLAEEKYSQAVKYLLLLLLFSFVLMFIIALPKLYMVRSQLDTGILDISKFTVDLDLQTTEPVSIPGTDPLIVLDTTGKDKLDGETLLITDSDLHYRLFTEEKKIKLNQFKLTDNRENSKKFLMLGLLLVLPSFLFYYFLAYLIKYAILLMFFATFSFILAKLVKNKIYFEQAVKLSFFTATPMILIEVLSMPFAVKDFLLSYALFPGIHISLVALTIYLSLYVTAIRVAGNLNLR